MLPIIKRLRLMDVYPKIQTVYLRDPATKMRTLLEGEFARPEFAYLQNDEWVFTEKVDGTNTRVLFNGEAVWFAGKTGKSEIPAFLEKRLEAIFTPLISVLAKRFPNGVCLFGEGYGSKIQKTGSSYRADQDFALFDVRVDGLWLPREAVESVAKELDVTVTPVIGRGTLAEMVALTREGFKSRWGNFTAEGIVARPAIELQVGDGSRVITKLKHKDFSGITNHKGV